MKKKCNYKQKGAALFYSISAATDAERYKQCNKQGMGLLNMSPSRVGCGLVYKNARNHLYIRCSLYPSLAVAS